MIERPRWFVEHEFNRIPLAIPAKAATNIIGTFVVDPIFWTKKDPFLR
jgi:hypothetical protein